MKRKENDMTSFDNIKKLILKYPKWHLEISYCSICDWMVDLRKRGYNDDGSDLVVYSGQDVDINLLMCKCEVALKEWLIENNGGY